MPSPTSRALTYDCPTCPAKAGTPCRAKGGKRNKDKATARRIERLTAAFVRADAAAQEAKTALLTAIEAAMADKS